MLLQRLHVVWLVASREDARVDAWMEGLDTAVHHLGKPRQLRNRARVDRRMGFDQPIRDSNFSGSTEDAQS